MRSHNRLSLRNSGGFRPISEYAENIMMTSARAALTRRWLPGEQQQAQRDTDKRRQQQPSRTAHVDLPPGLRDDNSRDGDRHQNGKRRSHMNRDPQGEQGNSHERLAESEH